MVKKQPQRQNENSVQRLTVATVLLGLWTAIQGLAGNYKARRFVIKPAWPSYNLSSTSTKAVITEFLPDQDWLDLAQASNFLPYPEDILIQRTANNSRPFSIRNQDFLRHHTHHCDTVDDLLLAIANGRREWENSIVSDNSINIHNRSNHNRSNHNRSNLTLFEHEQIPSSFIPYQCDVPIHSPDQICTILNQFPMWSCKGTPCHVINRVAS